MDQVALQTMTNDQQVAQILQSLLTDPAKDEDKVGLAKRAFRWRQSAQRHSQLRQQAERLQKSLEAVRAEIDQLAGRMLEAEESLAEEWLDRGLAIPKPQAAPGAATAEKEIGKTSGKGKTKKGPKLAEAK